MTPNPSLPPCWLFIHLKLRRSALHIMPPAYKRPQLHVHTYTLSLSLCHSYIDGDTSRKIHHSPVGMMDRKSLEHAFSKSLLLRANLRVESSRAYERGMKEM